MSETDAGLSELPDGWVWTTLEEVSELNLRIDKQSIDNDLEVTFLPMKNVEELSGKIDLSETKRFSELKRKSYTPFRDGDILFAKVTPCMENGKIAIAHDLKNGIGFGSTEFHVIRLSEEQSKQFFFFYFLQQKFRQEAKRAMTGAVGLLRVPTDYMRKVPIPLPPLSEQHYIAAKIEELFTRLNAGINALHKTQSQLKRYRQSVLKAAFEGKLTETWRTEHQDEIEPAAIQLECILKERREKWEAEQLEQMQAKGEMPKDNKWKANYKEPIAPDTSNLPELPKGWRWTTLPQIGELNRGKSKHRPRNAPLLYGGQYPFVQTGDIRHANGLIRHYNLTYSEEGLKQSRLWPAGTLCITIAANIADTAILGFDACFPDSIVGFLPERGQCNIYFVEFFLRTAKEDLERYAPATAQKNINLAILKDLAIPFPSLAEQNVIAQEINRHLSVADEVEKTITVELKRAEQLRQSILKKAFSGELVPQDSNDEPASVLLERIKTEKSEDIQGQLRLKLA